MELIRHLNCPHCGTEKALSPAAILVHCDACDCAYTVNGNRANSVGTVAVLTQKKSKLSLGVTGSIEGHAFTILGQIRYGNSSDFWSEWFGITGSGQVLWLVERGPQISFLQYDEIHDIHLNYSDMVIGQSIDVGGEQFLIHAKDTAVFESFEGEIPFDISIDRSFPYISGFFKDEFAILEFCDGAIARYRQRAVSLEELGI